MSLSSKSLNQVVLLYQNSEMIFRLTFSDGSEGTCGLLSSDCFCSLNKWSL